MPAIRPEPEDIIEEKLQKLKCSNNCQSIANYLIFGYGLYCTSCLSQTKGVTIDQAVSFNQLSKIIVQLIGEYNKKTKSQVSHVKVAKTQTQKGKQEIKKLRDSLNYDIKEVKQKSTTILNSLYTKCLKEHTLQALESLYEPDMTVTMILNEQKELLMKNLSLLQVYEDPTTKQISYALEDKSKHPKQVYKTSQKQYNHIRDVMEKSTLEVKKILQDFRNKIDKSY